jgi:hypothetical protein
VLRHVLHVRLTHARLPVQLIPVQLYIVLLNIVLLNIVQQIIVQQIIVLPLAAQLTHARPLMAAALPPIRAPLMPVLLIRAPLRIALLMPALLTHVQLTPVLLMPVPLTRALPHLAALHRDVVLPDVDRRASASDVHADFGGWSHRLRPSLFLATELSRSASNVHWRAIGSSHIERPHPVKGSA